ncbi:MAG: hypothetical protein U0802_13020 [Candidatus Binatia bacterium]
MRGRWVLLAGALAVLAAVAGLAWRGTAWRPWSFLSPSGRARPWPWRRCCPTGPGRWRHRAGAGAAVAGGGCTGAGGADELDELGGDAIVAAWAQVDLDECGARSRTTASGQLGAPTTDEAELERRAREPRPLERRVRQGAVRHRQRGGGAGVL